jgi:hypothetical protein
MATNRILLNELAAALGLPALLDDDEDLLILNFDDAPALSVSLDRDDALVVAACLGVAPPADPEFLEELLAANLMFRDTEGAALSLERQTRQVFLARRWSTLELEAVQGLERAVREFLALADVWQQALPRLASAADAAGEPGAHPLAGTLVQRA